MCVSLPDDNGTAAGHSIMHDALDLQTEAHSVCLSVCLSAAHVCMRVCSDK